MATTQLNDVELKKFAHFSDLTDEPLLQLSPIHGYEQMPLVSIEEAVQPLSSIVPDINNMLSIVKENCQEIRDGLTVNESASIMLYSINWEPKELSLSYILNQGLRDENRKRLEPWFLYLKLLMKSLSKLPSTHCYVYRGVPLDLSNDYPQGKTFTWWGFSLCTRSIEASESEQYTDKTRPRTRFKIECRSAKDICNHSLNKMGDELLLLPAQRYKIVSSLDLGNGVRIIQVKEIDSSLAAQSTNSDRASSISSSFSQRKPSISISISNASFCSVILKLAGSSRIYHNCHLEDLLILCKSDSWIDLSTRHLVDQDMPIVIQRAIIDKTCKGLYLTGNQFSSRSISILSDVLYNNLTLTELDLSDNHVLNAGVKSLMDILSTNKSALKRLHLGSNSISDKGVEYISEMLKTNKTLTHLLLTRNSFSNRGVHLLSNALASFNKSLEVLSIASNSLVTDMAVDSLIIMLKQNETLRELDVKFCNINNASVQRLREAANQKTNFKLYTSSNENNCSVS